MKTIKSVNSILKHPLVLVIIPFLVAVWLFYLFEVKGPQWILMPQDLGYTYTLNGLSVLLGRELGVLIHPAITVSYVHAGIIYLFYLISGTGELQTHVVANAEAYSVIVSHFTTLGIASCTGFLAWSVYRLTGQIKYAFISSMGIFLIPIFYWALNAFGCPESFLLMLMMLLTGLSCLYVNERVSITTFIIFSSILGALAIGTKFIALPMLALPFFLVRGLKAKVGFSVTFFLAVAIVFSPIYLEPLAFEVFKGNMKGLIGSAQLERNAGAGNLSLAVIDQSFTALTSYPLFLSVVIVQILLFPFIRPKYFVQNFTSYNIARINFTLLGTILIAIAFIALRPKVHYYVTYGCIQGVTIALSLFLLQRRSFSIDPDQWSKKLLSSAVILVFSALVVIGILPFKKELGRLDDQRVGAVRANELISKEKGNYALITAIPSSHVTTAYEHANQTSRFYYWQDIDMLMGPNWFNYNFDGVSVWDRSRQKISFKELSHHYSKILFWMSRDQFSFNEDGTGLGGILSPRAQFKILVGHAKDQRTLQGMQGREWKEILAELQGLEIVSINDSKRQGLQPNCSDFDNCYTLLPSGEGAFQPTAMALWFKYDKHVPFESEKERASSIHKAWRLEGMDNKGFWNPLKIVWDPKLLARDSQWVFKIDGDQKYRKFRLRGKTKKYCLKSWKGSPDWVYCKENDNLVNVRIYAKPPKTPSFRVLPKANYFYSKPLENKNNSHSLISTFWERNGPFPVLFTKKISSGDYIRSYTLGCAAHGDNGTDSTTRMPVSWKLFGIDKNGGSVLLDTQKNISPWRPSEKRTFLIKKRTSNIEKLILMVDKPQLSASARISSFLLDRSPPQKKQKIVTFSDNLIQSPFWEQAGGMPAALTVKLKSEQKIETYQLGAANHGENGVDSTRRMPLSWKFYGQLKGGNWVLLDSRQDVKPWAPNEKRSYPIHKHNTSNKPNKFSSVRLVVEKTLDGTVSRVSELKIHRQNLTHQNFNRPSKQRVLFNGFYFERCCLNFPAGIEMHLGKFEHVGSYILKADRHGNAAVDRMPSKWIFQGFDVFQRKWINLHRVDNSAQWKPKEERRYFISKPSAYAIYRLHVLGTHNKGEVLRISNISLYSPKKQKIVTFSDNLIQSPFWEQAGGMPAALTVKLKSEQKIETYQLGAANHGENGVDSTRRMPLSWKFYGQLKGGNWVLLDSRQDVKPWAPNEKRSYPIHKHNTSNKPNKFSSVRLVVEKTLDGTVSRVSELKIHRQNLTHQNFNRPSKR